VPEVPVYLAHDLADVLTWSGRLWSESQWSPAVRAADQRRALETLF
jgi:hypothetical protein